MRPACQVPSRNKALSQVRQANSKGRAQGKDTIGNGLRFGIDFCAWATPETVPPYGAETKSSVGEHCLPRKDELTRMPRLPPWVCLLPHLLPARKGRLRNSLYPSRRQRAICQPSQACVITSLQTNGRIRPEISQGAVWISDDLKTGPEIRGKALVQEIQLRRPESINLAGMSGELGIEHRHQMFGGVIL